jgi:hypothetical protein
MPASLRRRLRLKKRGNSLSQLSFTIHSSHFALPASLFPLYAGAILLNTSGVLKSVERFRVTGDCGAIKVF